ncbi:RNA polymerase II transcription factor SIII subunit A-domain-containing protein [Radiomyces spectabilis]|uniref:RNA polymerase II transcription factor SIII subunit A-domain-containing protein n=1 Tax=Radiomyces spectabilis TaxID=64574 RepID=UPI00221EA17B|nr:RNA polymerase II transcription factor SIII subunit A-domain-containing protein [Radiomyces spectabilis]KAI8391717.1 RNA polymerase II transcription factor SIII subunit A-domain-containing protein [Radiomyces spectabilis]
MSQQVKSLVVISQEVLSKHFEGLLDVGTVPYYLLKEPLKKATPQQLYRIERANPHLLPESDELWLSHCLCYKDIRDAYFSGQHQDPRLWRQLYLQRFEENERRRQRVSEKIKNQYNKIQHEKEARSIKVLRGIAPIRTGRSYDAAKRSRSSRLFQETKKAADKVHAIYHCRQPHAASPTPKIIRPSTLIHSSKPPSALDKAYRSNRALYEAPPKRRPSSPLIPPPSKLDLPALPSPHQRTLPKKTDIFMPRKPASSPSFKSKSLSCKSLPSSPRSKLYKLP